MPGPWSGPTPGALRSDFAASRPCARASRRAATLDIPGAGSTMGTAVATGIAAAAMGASAARRTSFVDACYDHVVSCTGLHGAAGCIACVLHCVLHPMVH